MDDHRIARLLEFEQQNIPKLIPEVELESLDGNDNQMHQCSDGTSLQRKIILEGFPKKYLNLWLKMRGMATRCINAQMRQLLLELSNVNLEDGVPLIRWL